MLPPTSLTTRRHFLRSALAAALLALPAALCGQAPAGDGSVRFLAVGDWGRDGTAFQLPVAAQMGRTAAAERSQFVVALGDNFYNDGVPSVEARQWRSSFEDVYTAASLQIPWYVLLGNHDYHGSVQAQLDYPLFSPRWKMPARYYTFTRRLDADNTVQFFMIDTTPLLRRVRADPSEYTDVLTQDPDLQMAWLEAELKKSTARWKIVAGHHPIYSCSPKHGDTPELVERVKPLMLKYGARIYLNGHEHDLEHLRVDGLDFFCSGAGSKVRQTARDARTIFSLGDVGGFLSVVLTRDEFRGRFVDHLGQEVYTVVIPWAGPVAAR
ncbi:MAG: metallophosphoesterase [Opitutaceae bacterium]|nr:metallophosphoesterase [Opitutaceae bacterium]